MNIFVGVIAGIITYIVIEIAIKIFRNMVIPWYQTRIYKGHNIQGEWYGHSATVDGTGEYNSSPESESTISVRQQGNKIRGELLLTMQPNGEKCRKLFQLEGSFVDTILVLNLNAKDTNNMGIGSLIMKLTENGEKLKGKQTFISAHDWSTVASRDQIWIRRV